MVDWLFYFLLGQSTVIGTLLLVAGLFGLKLNGYMVLSVATIELALLGQLAVSFGVVLAGSRAEVSTFEYFGYLLVALLIPVAGSAWALLEKTRWSTVVLGCSALTISVMLIRMWQIWDGAYPF
jgi:hypothetical protein